MTTPAFIPAGRLEQLVTEFVATVRAAEARVERESERNVIDPFSAVFDAALAGISIEEWMKLEKARQAQKSLQNALGAFHQKLLGSIDGWTDTQAGGSVDLRSDSRSIIAEVKNKYNTMNSASAEATFRKLATHLRYTDKGYTAYLVQIIPKTAERYDRPWTHSVKIDPLRDYIRVIDGGSFYDLVTGETNALAQVYDALPGVLATVLGRSEGDSAADPASALLFQRVYGV